MAVHPSYVERFPLLEGIESFEQLMSDPALEERFHGFMQWRDAAAPPDVETHDLTVPGPHGPVPVRVYTPAGSSPTGHPCLVWMHGGAFVGGDLDMPEADRTSREVCARAGAVVVSVDYRLAVGGVHHPVPLDDVVAVVRWVRDGADLGVDPGRIAVGGASAGANLATAAVLRLRDEDGWQPAVLIPVYGVFHPTLPPTTPDIQAAMTEVPPLLRFTEQATAGITANYVGGPPESADGYAMPALADLTGLCPTLMLDAEHDDLRRSEEPFHAALTAAGVDVRRHVLPGVLHGFLNLPAEVEPVGRAFQLIADAVTATAPVTTSEEKIPMAESPTPAVDRVLVVGGGIAGGVLSLALAQHGVAVVLVDLRTTLGGVGHGITLQGNALKAFRSVGIYDQLAEHGFPFSHLRLKTADGHVMAEIPTPPMGGPDLPGTMGAVRGDIADILAVEVEKAGVDIRLETTVTAIDDHGDSVTVTLSDGSTETVDLLVGADGIRSQVRSMIGIETQPHPVGMGIWRTVAKRPASMDCSELYYGGPKYKAGYTPISEDLCYAFLLEENLDRSFVGEGPHGALLKERGQGYGGLWGEVRDSLADDAIVNYQWIEAICVDEPWFRGRTIIIGDAAHACPPLIAQGAAMCAEDAVVLAEMLTSGSPVDEVLPAFMARRFPRVEMVLDNSLQLAEWEIHPDTPGADPGRIMGQTLGALVAPA